MTMQTQQDREITASKWADKQKKARTSRSDSEREPAAEAQQIAEHLLDIILAAEDKSHGIDALAWALGVEIRRAVEAAKQSCRDDFRRQQRVEADDLERRVKQLFADVARERAVDDAQQDAHNALRSR